MMLPGSFNHPRYFDLLARHDGLGATGGLSARVDPVQTLPSARAGKLPVAPTRSVSEGSLAYASGWCRNFPHAYLGAPWWFRTSRWRRDQSKCHRKAFETSSG